MLKIWGAVQDEDVMLRTHPFVQEVITEVSARKELCAGQKEGEKEYEYFTRTSSLLEAIEKTTIAEIGAKFDGLRSEAGAGSISAEDGTTQQVPALTITLTGSERVDRGASEQGLGACSN